jgi:hypothetical protein
MITDSHPFVFLPPSSCKIIVNIGRKRYYASFQNKQSLLDLLSETEVGEQVYNSNAIENSTLTLGVFCVVCR